MKCCFCAKAIEFGTAAVSIVGGMFPVEDPDFFMVDESVMAESHAHLPCLLAAVGGKGREVQGRG